MMFLKGILIGAIKKHVAIEDGEGRAKELGLEQQEEQQVLGSFTIEG